MVPADLTTAVEAVDLWMCNTSEEDQRHLF